MYTSTKVAELVTYANSVLLDFIRLWTAVNLEGICLQPFLSHTAACRPISLHLLHQFTWSGMNIMTSYHSG